MRTTIAMLTVLVVAAAGAQADGDAGFAGPFMRSGVGARPLGMGGAFTAVAEGPEATYYNPAGLGFNLKVGGSLSYKTLSLGRHLGHIAFAFPIRNEAAMAASWVNAGVSDVFGRGSSRQVSGEIANNQNAFTLSFAKAFHSSISIGGSLRYLQEKLDRLDVFAIGADFGFMYRLENVGSFGLAIQNLGSNYRWDTSNYWSGGTTYEEMFPIVIKFGAAGNLLKETLVPAVDFETSDKMGLRFRAGAEYWFVRKAVKFVEDEYEEGKMNEVIYNERWAALRIGLDKGSPTFGGTLQLNRQGHSAAIEYAFLVGRFGTSAGHIFTLKFGF